MKTSTHDVYYPVLTILRFGKPFGMSPVTIKDLRKIDSSSHLGPTSLITAIMVSAAMVTSYAASSILEQSSPTKARKLHVVLDGFRVIGASLTVILMLQRHTHLVESLKKLRSFDEKLASLGVTVSYFRHHIFVVLACVITLCAQAYSSYTIAATRPSSNAALIFFSQGYQFAIAQISVIHLNYFCFVLRAKLNFVIDLAKNLRDDATKKVYAKKPLEILLMMSEMYDDLYQATREINRVVSVPVLILSIGDVLQAMVMMNLTYRGEHDLADLVDMSLYAFQLIATFLPPMYIGTKPKRIMRILAECDVCYRDRELAKAKDTLLYQTLQQQIEMTVCGLFPMSLSALSEQIGLCISLILFLNQLVELK